MNGWRCADLEWPPEDGEYYVTNMPECPAMDTITGLWMYDGYGFYREKGRYIMAHYWKPKPEKRYGKVPSYKTIDHIPDVTKMIETPP